MTLGATKFGIFISFLLVFSAHAAVPDKRQNLDKDEYEDVPDKPFPGRIEIMPIVQRDTKHKDVSETVQEIIRELPNDEQYERIGKMLNNSYDAMNREAAEGKTAIRQKMVVSGDRTARTNSATINMAIMHASIILGIMGISIIIVI
ncbi:unnamed protein product [Caenorhabditis sp. 36 PRJEB53466]|nr:unnamed protein product [Caenorhabditis sp. 36 PRJEB53466]